MCRMLGAIWRNPRGARTVSELIRILYRASSNDHLLRGIAGDGRHCHGYGYLLLASSGGGWALSWRRFDAADELGSGEESCVENLRALERATQSVADDIVESSRGLILFHARRAGRGEPRGSLHAHPYIVPATKLGHAILALMHNGGVEKKALAGRLGVDPGLYTDSNLLALWMASNLTSEEDLEALLDEARGYTKSALDVVIALLRWRGRLEASMHIYSYIASGDPLRLEYYKPILFKAEGTEGYISSTIAEIAAEKLKLDMREAGEKLYSMRLL